MATRPKFFEEEDLGQFLRRDGIPGAWPSMSSVQWREDVFCLKTRVLGPESVQ